MRIHQCVAIRVFKQAQRASISGGRPPQRGVLPWRGSPRSARRASRLACSAPSERRRSERTCCRVQTTAFDGGRISQQYRRLPPSQRQHCSSAPFARLAARLAVAPWRLPCAKAAADRPQRAPAPQLAWRGCAAASSQPPAYRVALPRRTAFHLRARCGGGTTPSRPSRCTTARHLRTLQ